MHYNPTPTEARFWNVFLLFFFAFFLGALGVTQWASTFEFVNRATSNLNGFMAVNAAISLVSSVILIQRIVRGREFSCKGTTVWAAGGLVCVPFWILYASLFQISNAVFDDSTAQQIEVVVVDKTIRRGGRGTTSHQLWFTDWKNPNARASLVVSSEKWGFTPLGARALAQAKRGFWGVEWWFQKPFQSP